MMNTKSFVRNTKKVISDDVLNELLPLMGYEFIIKNYDLNLAQFSIIEPYIVDWNTLVISTVLSKDIIMKYKQKIDFSILNLNSYFNLDEECIIQNSAILDFERLSYRDDLSFDLISNNKDRFHWNILCLNRQFTENEIEQLLDKVNWTSLTISHQFSKEFLLKYKDFIDIKYLKLQGFTQEELNSNQKYKEYIDVKIKEFENINQTYSFNDECVEPINRNRWSKFICDINVEDYSSQIRELEEKIISLGKK